MIILSKEKKESNREGGREVRKGRGGERKKGGNKGKEEGRIKEM